MVPGKEKKHIKNTTLDNMGKRRCNCIFPGDWSEIKKGGKANVSMKIYHFKSEA